MQLPRKTEGCLKWVEGVVKGRLTIFERTSTHIPPGRLAGPPPSMVIGRDESFEHDATVHQQ